MIKDSLKIFAKNLVYLFIAMGLVYLFLIIGAYVFISATLQNLSRTIGDIGALINSSVQQSSASVQDFLNYSFAKIDWNGNFFATLKQIFSTNWLTETFKGFFDTLNVSSENFGAELSGIIADFKGKVMASLSVALATVYVGINLANFATRYAIRRKNAKRNFKKLIIAHTVVPLLQSLILGMFFALLPVIEGYSFLVAFALIIVIAFISLLGSWVVYKEGNLKLKEVLTFKNALRHLGVLFIILLINVAADALLYLLSPILAILFMVPFAIYSFGVCDVNTDIFVRSLVEKQPAQPQTDEQVLPTAE